MIEKILATQEEIEEMHENAQEAYIESMGGEDAWNERQETIEAIIEAENTAAAYNNLKNNAFKISIVVGIIIIITLLTVIIKRQSKKTKS